MEARMTVVMKNFSELGLVLEYPEPACARTFRSVEEMELHISVGQHTESVYDKLKRGWVEKSHPLPFQMTTVPMLSRGRVANLSSRI